MRMIGLILAILSTAQVASAGTKKVQAGKAKVGVNLQTDIQFGASTLHGQYQTPAEALAKVEDEKNLSDLLIPRTNFKDRMAFEVQGSQ